MVDNPEHHPHGDFALRDAVLSNQAHNRMTYAGIGVFRAELFADLDGSAAALAPLLRRAADSARATGQHHQGAWLDVGTPQRLAQLRARLAAD